MLNDGGNKIGAPFYNRVRGSFSRVLTDFLERVEPHGYPQRKSVQGASHPPRSSMSTADWLQQKGRGALYTPVASAYEGSFDEPVRVTPPTKLHDCYPWDRPSFSIEPQFALELCYARVVGRYGTVITHDDVFLSDLARAFKDRSLMANEPLPPVKALNGRFAVLTGPGNSTYHWLYDSLPRLEVLRLAGYKLSDFDGFFMTKPKYEPHYETLDLLGIPREKIIWLTKIKNFECRRLVVGSYTNNGRESSPFVYPFLRQMMRLSSEERCAPKRCIFITRKASAKAARRIINEEELALVLEAYGFESFALEGLSFTEQMKLFASAEAIVSPHGGGLSNLCFCDPGTPVLELFGPDYTPAYYRAIAVQMGHPYRALVGESMAPEERALEGGDMTIDPTLLKQCLREMLGS